MAGPRNFDPIRLDVEAFIKAEEALASAWPLGELPRLQEASMPGAESAVDRRVDWQARGELRAQRAGEPERWLRLTARVSLPLQCQRCLQPVETPIEVDRMIRFVRGEEAAAELDEQIDDDVLALQRSLDLRELIEDELLLALPLVPRHDVCPAPLPMTAGEIEASAPSEDAAHPFAALAALKRDKRLN
jgi:uncharacterized protein